MKSVTIWATLLVTLFSFFTVSALSGPLQLIGELQSSCPAVLFGQVTPEVFTYKKSTFFNELKNATKIRDKELIQTINEYLERELSASGGTLTGIGSFRGGLKGFLFDMASAQTNMPVATHKPQSQQLLANYLGNAFQGTLMRLNTPSDTIRVPVYEPKLGPSFRLEEYIYFKELVERLNSNPRQVYNLVGLDFSRDNAAVFTDSLSRLNKIFGIPTAAPN